MNNRATRDRLVTENLGLAGWAAKKWGHGLDFDDAFQIACLGLMRAAETYDPDRGPFATYAWNWLWQNLLNANREAAPVHVPPKVWQNHKPTRCALPVRRFDDGNEQDMLPAPDERTEDVALALVHIERLPPQWRYVLRRRLAGFTLKEIGASMGVSRERVRQVQSAALRRLNGARVSHSRVPRRRRAA
jgi:RNA polymerase sigma factor (sigma-70 family)